MSPGSPGGEQRMPPEREPRPVDADHGMILYNFILAITPLSRFKGVDMKKLIGRYSVLIMLVFLFSASMVAVAQQSDPSQWRITEKEVVAVQAELFRRGYYTSKPSGVLDRNTRTAVRSYQTENGLSVTGRIDRPTYESLGLTYPATGDEADSLRRTGLLSRIGYGVKDKTVAAGQTVGGAVVGGAGKVKEGTQTGLEKTWDLGSSAASRTKEAAQGVGGASVRGARSLSRSSQRLSTSMIGRSDAEVHAEVRELLEENPETIRWVTDVKDGMVTVKPAPGTKADIGQVISNIRKIAGVKSVFVINL